MDAQVLEICVKIFNGVLVLCMYFLLPLFLIRVILASLSGNSNEILNTLKGVVFFFILVHSYEPILQVLFSFTTSVGSEVASSLVTKTKEISPLFSTASLSDKIANFTSPPWVLRVLLEGAMVIIYWIGVCVYFAFMAILSSLAPVLFLLSCVLGIGIGVRTFFAFLFLASSWPVIWLGLDVFSKTFGAHLDSEMGRVVLEIFVGLLKIVGPIWFTYSTANSSPAQGISQASSAAYQKYKEYRKDRGKNELGSRGFSHPPTTNPSMITPRIRSFNPQYGKSQWSYQRVSNSSRVSSPISRRDL